MQLQELDATHESAFLAMIADYQENDAISYTKFFESDAPWNSHRFALFFKNCQRQKMDWRPGPNKISVTRYVLVDAHGRICGNGVMRFPLDEHTELEGGNLHFDVPPSLRGHGYGALVLNGMLFEAVRAGMARVLVTCDADHGAAIRAIERNRGELQDQVPSRRPDKPSKMISRFWIRFR